MKRIIFPLLFLIASSTFAQFGIRAGVEFPTIVSSGTNNDINYSGTSYLGGLFYNFQLNEKIGIRPEIQYIYARNIDDNVSLNNLLIGNQLEFTTVITYQFANRWYALLGVAVTEFITSDDIDDNAISPKGGFGFKLSEKMALEFSMSYGIGDRESTEQKIFKDSAKISYIITF